MVLGVLIGAAWACDALEPQLDRVQALVLDVRLDDADAGLQALSGALGCGPPMTPAQVARYFLLDGALASLQGRATDATDSFAAAGRADPAVWIEGLGPALRSKRDAAVGRPPPPTGTLTVRPADVPVRLDGAEWAGGPVPGGLHVVQVLGADGRVGFGRVLLVQADTEQVVNSGMLPPAAAPSAAPTAVVAETAPAPRRGGPSPALFAGVGATAWFGRDLSGHTSGGDLLEEPAVKVLTPLELGGELGLGPAWVRAAATAGPLLGGRLLYGVDGEWTGSPWAFGGDVGAGVHAAGLSLGVTGGVALPGRLAGRLVAGKRWGPVRTELRAGLNRSTSGAFEPAGGLWLLLDVPPGGGR